LLDKIDLCHQANITKFEYIKMFLEDQVSFEQLKTKAELDRYNEQKQQSPAPEEASVADPNQRPALDVGSIRSIRKKPKALLLPDPVADEGREEEGPAALVFPEDYHPTGLTRDMLTPDERRLVEGVEDERRVRVILDQIDLCRQAGRGRGRER